MKTARFELKLSPEHKTILRKAAAWKETSIGSFVLDAALSKAALVLKAAQK